MLRLVNKYSYDCHVDLRKITTKKCELKTEKYRGNE